MNNSDFSEGSLEDIKKIIEEDVPDDTLSLSIITKEKPHTKDIIKQKTKTILDQITNSRLRKGDFSNISHIEKQNISGLSHSYEIFTNSNITPAPGVNQNSSLANNRYALMQGISKSDLSTSFIRQKIERSDLGEDRPYGKDYTPPPNFGNNYPRIDPNAFRKSSLPGDNSKSRVRKVSQSQNSMSALERSSISRIFQPSPSKIPDLSN